jgi:excisionase family DNA binding protein
MPTALYTISESAALLSVSRRTLVGWISDGRVPVVNLNSGLHKRPMLRIAGTTLAALAATGRYDAAAVRGNAIRPVRSADEPVKLTPASQWPQHLQPRKYRHK